MVMENPLNCICGAWGSCKEGSDWEHPCNLYPIGSLMQELIT